MGKTYDKASPTTISQMKAVMAAYHQRLMENDVRVGVLMVYAHKDPKTGEKKGNAIEGLGGQAGAACIKVVPLKDRLTKGYDAEMMIDGDAWPSLSESSQEAILDHELTHLVPEYKTDDLRRPILKIRDEDFAVWGFISVVERHGKAAMEYQGLKHLLDEHGKQLLLLPE